MPATEEETPPESEELTSLPSVLSGRQVTAYLEPYGYLAHTPLDWKSWTVPELVVRVTGHTCSGGHTLYNLECSLWRSGQRRRAAAASSLPFAGLKSAECESSSSLSTAATGESIGASEDAAEAEEPPWLTWRAARRLAHLREGLHDSVKRQLGSSYETYFCRVPFAHRLRPSGTTARLDAWCGRLAYCISTKLVSPAVTAETLRLLGAPCVPRRDPELLEVHHQAESSGGYAAASSGAPERGMSSQADSLASFVGPSFPDLPQLDVQQADEPELFVSRREKHALPEPEESAAASGYTLSALKPERLSSPRRKHAIDIQLPGLEHESDGEGAASAQGSLASGAASDDSGDERFFEGRMKSKELPPEESNPFE
eukprot:TRINITY_DN24868_c0_g1_i1.p1 TRINITY_DN24868_c0_g1~~TRINITY_DN24868_c0_g1_i1.p1  ORF type:complete len:372 (-),score=74.12 TRINITY_DN24868_c0_g1_i1:105-1220(-)